MWKLGFSPTRKRDKCLNNYRGEEILQEKKKEEVIYKTWVPEKGDRNLTPDYTKLQE